jgi:hypothetical protein
MKLHKLAAAIILLAGVVLNAGAFVGKVTEQIAAVSQIQRAKSTVEGTKGAGIEMNDSIKTGSGKVGITFEDDTKVQITENSKLVIDDFVYDPKSKSGGKLAVKIALGTVRYASGQVAKNNPQNVAITTPTATIGVRGTDFTTTVDEVGASTVVLLPSCPAPRTGRTVKDIEYECVVGEIIVTSDMGTVILNKAFQATKVSSRMNTPTKPVILNFSEDQLNNMMLFTSPKELQGNTRDDRRGFKSALDIDFLKEKGLENALDASQKEFFGNRLSQDYLTTTSFLENIFDMVGGALNEDLLKDIDSQLPDWKRSSGIQVFKDELGLTLYRDNGSDIQSVTIPLTQSAIIYQTQGSLEFKNRVNSGNNTIITLTQK